MKFIPNAVSTKAARSILIAQKHSPQTLFIGGLLGVGATVVLACRATLKVEEVLNKTETELFRFDESRTSPDFSGQVSDKDARRERSRIYIHATLELGKLYGPAIICGVASVAALAGANNILNKRNAALVAAYGTIEKTFGEYRDRVAAEVGREKENEIYHDACEIEETDEKGKKILVKKANGGGLYSHLFDQHNPNWESMPEYNFLFLKAQQTYANQRLQARGHLFLNEVLDALGIEHTVAGAVTGWIKGEGDGYVDFGIFNEEQSERVLDFMVGRENAIWLDFNVDGTIYDKI